MSNRVTDFKKLEALKPGQFATVNWCDGGGGEVQRVGDTYELSYVPQFGGTPELENVFKRDQFEQLLDLAYEWT